MNNKAEKTKLLLIIITAALIIWSLSVSNRLTFISGNIYDFYVNLFSNTFDSNNKTDHQLLLVELDDKVKTSDSYWKQFFKTLMPYQPELVLINHFPENVSDDFYRFVQQYPQVYFLQYHIEDKNQLKADYITPRPTANKNIKINTIQTRLPEPEYGVFRRSSDPIHDSKNRQETSKAFELQVLKIHDKEQLSKISQYHNLDEQFLINFLSSNRNLPLINSQMINQDKLIPELIQDKIVLIGHSLNKTGYSFYTPLSTSYPVSLLELQAYSLATFIEDKIIYQFSPLALGLVLLLQSLLVFIFYQSGLRRFNLYLNLAISLLVLLSAWVLLHFALVWIPVFEIVVFQFLAYYFTYRYQSINDEEVLQKILLNVTSRSQERMIPTDFYQLDDPWKEVISLVNQTLNLNRVIFLERIEGDHRLKEVKAFNCSIDDIHEMRRDYERFPYSDAIEKNTMIKIDQEKRPFLITQEKEDQYLVPLTMGNDILGFWAFGLNPQLLSNNPVLLALVNDYSRQISELLFYRQRFQQIMKSNRSILRYIGLKGEQSSQRLLKQTLELLNNRLDSHESVFRGMKTSTVLFDLFGRVVQINDAMEQFTQNLNLSIYDMTSIDFVSELTGMNLENVRNIMQHVITERKLFNLPVKQKEKINEFLILNIKPLQSFKSDNSSIEEDNAQVVPFQLMGILIEVNDLTRIKDDITVKDKMNEHFFYQIRNDAEPLLMGINMLNSLSDGKPVSDANNEQQQKVLKLLTEKISHSSRMIKTMHQYFNQNSDESFGIKSVYPVEPVGLIKQQVYSEKILELCENNPVQLNHSQSEALIYAEPQIFKEAFFIMIKILQKDATENSEIIIELTDNKEFITIKLYNSGFGIPSQNFQAMLNGENSTSADYNKLQELMFIMQSWNGSISGNSEIGVGTHFELNVDKVFY